MPPSRRLFLEASVGLAGLGTAYATPPEAAIDPAFEPAYLKLHRTGELRRRGDALWLMLESCRLCPRECGAARLRGEKGFCHGSRDVEASSHHPHFGEERSLVGRGGSGTIFLTNCNLRCVFCINWGGAARVPSVRHFCSDRARARAISMMPVGMVFR